MRQSDTIDFAEFGDQLHGENLSKFVEISDKLGGPGSDRCNEFWSRLRYIPRTPLDEQLSPLTRLYQKQQASLYEEMTGHKYTESVDEFTPNVPVSAILDAPNAYIFMSPRDYAKHCVAMGALVQELKLEKSHSVLELGSGWGFCQEFLANCGIQSSGIDTNPDFVSASNARLERLGYGRRVERTNFSEIDKIDRSFDVILTYEAFHHSVDPLETLFKAKKLLKSSGRFVLAAEPFNDFYSSWGLRLDPYSIYCIKKFGWFESGWSEEYMAYLLGYAGFESRFIDLGYSDLTRYMIGELSGKINSLQLGLWHPEVMSSIVREAHGVFSTANTLLYIPRMSTDQNISLELENYSVKPLRVDTEYGNIRKSLLLSSGKTDVPLGIQSPLPTDHAALRLFSQTFRPCDDGINDDVRQLGVFVHGIRLT